MYPPHSQCFTFSHFIYILFFLPDLPDHGEAHQFTDHFKELALVLVLFSPVLSLLPVASVLNHFLLVLALVCFIFSPLLSSSSISNKSTENCVFPYKHGFCCVPQMLMFLFIVSSGFLVSPGVSPWTYGLLRSYNTPQAPLPVSMPGPTCP